MPKIKNMGQATVRFNEGVIVSGSAGVDTHTRDRDWETKKMILWL